MQARSCKPVRTLVIALGVFSTSVLLNWTSVVEASCLAPAFDVLWTYPRQDERDVPLDSQLWTLVNQVPITVVAELNGSPLPPAEVTGSAQRWALPRLRAQTEYLFRAIFEHPTLAGRRQRVVEIRFMTGKRVTRKPPQPRVVGQARLASDADRSHFCDAVLIAQACFSRHPLRVPGFDRFELADRTVNAWTLEGDTASTSQLWPSRCGPPTIAIPDVSAPQCYSIRGVGAGGTVSRARRVCVKAASAKDAAPSRGTSIGAPPIPPPPPLN